MAYQHEVRYINAYVSGTTACKLEMQPEKKKKVRLPKPRKQEELVIKVDAVAVLGVAVAVILAVMLVIGSVRLYEANREVEQLSQYVSVMQEQNAALEEAYHSGYDLEQVRNIALSMGMVESGSVTHLQMEVTVPEPVQEPTAWESFVSFLTGLFA